MSSNGCSPRILLRILPSHPHFSVLVIQPIKVNFPLHFSRNIICILLGLLTRESLINWRTVFPSLVPTSHAWTLDLCELPMVLVQKYLVLVMSKSHVLFAYNMCSSFLTFRSIYRLLARLMPIFIALLNSFLILVIFRIWHQGRWLAMLACFFSGWSLNSKMDCRVFQDHSS